MENSCKNVLTIIGPSQTLAHFKSAVIGYDPTESSGPGERPNLLNFNNFVPIPRRFRKNPNEGAAFAWQERNWGCRWGATRVKVTRCGPNVIRYEFDTAVNPPVNWLRRIACRFPKLFMELLHTCDTEGPGARTIFIASEVTYHLVRLPKKQPQATRRSGNG